MNFKDESFKIYRFDIDKDLLNKGIDIHQSTVLRLHGGIDNGDSWIGLRWRFNYIDDLQREFFGLTCETRVIYDNKVSIEQDTKDIYNLINKSFVQGTTEFVLKLPAPFNKYGFNETLKHMEEAKKLINLIYIGFE